MALRFEGAAYTTAASETVLQTLLRHGVDVSHSCGKGVCQVCLLRSNGEAPPAAAQHGLRDTLRQQGYFLACQCPATDGMEIMLPRESEVFGRALVSAKELLSADLCRLWLTPATALYYHPGQFLNLRRADGLMRSYSIASVPRCDAMIELHIQRRQEGAMSQWIIDTLQVGDAVDIQGPNGACFYLPGREHDTLLLIGTGTGLAPLIGIVRDALTSGHQGPIYLYHGSHSAAGLYRRAQLAELAAQHENFHAVFCASGPEVESDCIAGRAHDIAFGRHTDLSGFRVYLCGAPAMVHAARKTAYLNGARVQDIYADPFENKDLRQTPRD
jgi:NAD(P)H-flavin reductase/ferredoxin